MKNVTLRFALVLVVLTAAVGCKSAVSPTEESSKFSPEQAVAARQALVAWFECEECSSGELEAVTKLGQSAIPSLAATLRAGPSPSSREIQHEHLVQTYREMQVYAKAHPRESNIKVSEEEYVRQYSENYVALYQIRAARALESIGGEQARKALTEALNSSLRDDVRSVVKESLQKLSSSR